jgi:hypothetical protein
MQLTSFIALTFAALAAASAIPAEVPPHPSTHPTLPTHLVLMPSHTKSLTQDVSSSQLAPRTAVRRQPRRVQQAGQRRRRPPVLRRSVLLRHHRVQQRLPDGQHLRRAGIRVFCKVGYKKGRDDGDWDGDGGKVLENMLLRVAPRTI